MRISDWSSDVCSSDLGRALIIGGGAHAVGGAAEIGRIARDGVDAAGDGDRRACADLAGIIRGRDHDRRGAIVRRADFQPADRIAHERRRSEEHTSELQSLMRISYAVFCLKKKKTTTEKN